MDSRSPVRVSVLDSLHDSSELRLLLGRVVEFQLPDHLQNVELAIEHHAAQENSRFLYPEPTQPGDDYCDELFQVSAADNDTTDSRVLIFAKDVHWHHLGLVLIANTESLIPQVLGVS